MLPIAETIPEETLYMEAEEQSNPVLVDVLSNPLFGEIADVEVDTSVQQVQNLGMYGTLIWAVGLEGILLYGLPATCGCGGG